MAWTMKVVVECDYPECMATIETYGGHDSQAAYEHIAIHTARREDWFYSELLEEFFCPEHKEVGERLHHKSYGG